MPIAAFRHNNPFDVSLPIAGYNGPGNVVGIQGQSGYGSFPDMATGYSAGVQRLNSYITGQSSHGPKSTIGELNTVYATDPNWSRGVSKFSGIGADEKLNPNDPAQMSKLQYGVLAQEIGPDNAARVVQEHGGGGAYQNADASAPAQTTASTASASTAVPYSQQAPQQQAAQPIAPPPLFQQAPAAPIYYAPRRIAQPYQSAQLFQSPYTFRG